MSPRAAWIAGALAAWLAAAGCHRGGQPAAPKDAGQPLTAVPGADPRSASGAQIDQAGDYTVVAAPLASRRSAALRSSGDPYGLAGQQLGPWQLSPWANSAPLSLEQLRGRVVVLRFWTDTSEACAYTMPALERLAEEFRGRPVTFIGAYVPHDSLLATDWGDALARARQWKITFPLAYDRQGWTLNQWWLSRLDNLPLTPTFVLAADGRVAYVHPGPGFFATDDPLYRLCNEDYAAIRGAIGRALKEQLADSSNR